MLVELNIREGLGQEMRGPLVEGRDLVSRAPGPHIHKADDVSYGVSPV